MTGYRICWSDLEGRDLMETVRSHEEVAETLRMIVAAGVAALAWVEPITPRDDDHGQDEDPILILEIDGRASVDQGSFQLGQHLEDAPGVRISPRRAAVFGDCGAVASEAVKSGEPIPWPS